MTEVFQDFRNTPSCRAAPKQQEAGKFNLEDWEGGGLSVNLCGQTPSATHRLKSPGNPWDRTALTRNYILIRRIGMDIFAISMTRLRFVPAKHDINCVF